MSAIARPPPDQTWPLVIDVASGSDPHESIKIVEALYGELGVPQKCMNVTDILNRWLELYDGTYLRHENPEFLRIEGTDSHRLSAETKNNLPGFKDPARGRKKFLKVTYLIGGAEKQQIVGEYEELELLLERPRRVQPEIARSQPLLLKDNFKLVDELLRRYAPEVRLHHEEQYFPSSVEWYLALCELAYDGKQGGDSDPRLAKQVDSFQQLSQTITVGGVVHTTEEPSSDFYVAPSRDHKAQADVGQKNLESVPVYAHVLQYDDTKEIDLQYYFFYPYNGPIVALLSRAGTHEGDWEHVTVRLAPDGSLKSVFMDTYPKEHRWYMQQASSPRAHDGYQLNSEGHPIVWAAKHSHTCYAWAGLQRRTIGLGIVDELTDDLGLRWLTWKNVINVGNPDRVLNGQTWVKFTGLWGTPARTKLEYGGKRTPSQWPAFRFGDPQVERACMVPVDAASHLHSGLSPAALQQALMLDSERAFTWARWKHLDCPFKITCMAAGPRKSSLFVCDESGTLYRWNGLDWLKQPAPAGGFASLSMGEDGVVWGLTKDGVAFRRDDPQSDMWVEVAERRFACIAALSGKSAWALQLQSDAVLSWNGAEWTAVAEPPQPLAQLAVGADGLLWALSASGAVYRKIGSEWQETASVTILARLTAVHELEAWGVDLEGRLLSWNGSSFRYTGERFDGVSANSEGVLYAWDSAQASAYKLCERVLRLAPVRSFARVCDDRGIDAGATFFRPVPPPGYFILGDYVEQTQLTHVCGGAAVLTVKEDANDDVGPPLLAEPAGYECVWMSAGTRAKQEFSIWKPIAPEGYVALGHVVLSSVGMAPELPLRCVHASAAAVAVVKPCGPDKWLWSDKKGSGKMSKASLWASAEHDAATELAAGTFITSTSYDPPAEPPACLRLPAQP